MKIDCIVELPSGAMAFKGELTPEETQLVVELGFNFLAKSGAFNSMAIAMKAHNTAQGQH